MKLHAYFEITTRISRMLHFLEDFMKKFLIILLFLCFSLTGCGNNDNLVDNQDQNNNYSASRITATDNTTNNNNNTNTNSNIESNNISINNIESIDNINTETELSSFTTKIYTPDDESRQKNIRITCSKLNGTVVKSRRNFFFL